MWDSEEGWTSEILDIVREDIENTTRYYALERGQFLNFAKGLGQFFYLIDHRETSFEDTTQVPNFFRQSWPYFILFIVLENLILILEGKPSIRLNDTITSLSNGLIQECGRLLFRGGESLAYVFIYNHFRIVDLKWDYALTWYAAAIGVDFCYYWVHRASHEVHILWAQHQVHHSSEEFNLAVGLRQSALQGWCGFIFYLPMAFIIPPAHFLTHQQFSLLYQFWIHTKAITTLGPLEYIFNTPRHHRVHHGCNKYCLDKNYGGFLIIWDRMFGTFAQEREKEDIVYGLVYNQPSFNPLHLQTFYTVYVMKAIASYNYWWFRFAAAFAGPSWSPGKPRLGEETEKMDIRHRKKYDVVLPVWCNFYLLIHFGVVVYGFQELAIRHMGMTPLSVLYFVIYILASLTVMGMMFDRHPAAMLLELFRCLVFAYMSRNYAFEGCDKTTMLCFQIFYVTSALWWCLYEFRVMEIKERKIK
ncbi:alkylglycerol monooxygenase-like [Arctopsyche grandis]|uniref:alkylglycerol monooxygenase-like n=1 Tax=Arctopsyche grandis TaxID=121162 RepID=UPI00406D92C3